MLMLLAAAAAISSAMPHPTQLDALALNPVIVAVTRLETDENPNVRRFEKVARRSNVAVWQRLQSGMPDTRRGYASLAFALAYYHLDYLRNIYRLLAPYRRSVAVARLRSPEAQPTDGATTE